MNRIKRNKLVSINLHGMVGVGPTKAAAKEDAGRKIEAALSGFYTPTVVRWRGWVGILWRTPEGYCYRVSGPDTPDGILADGCTCMCAGDRAEALESVLWHIAQNEWDVESPHGSPLLDGHPEKQQEFVRWCAWQKAARHAQVVLGMTNHNELHRWASNHQGNFMPE